MEAIRTPEEFANYQLNHMAVLLSEQMSDRMKAYAVRSGKEKPGQILQHLTNLKRVGSKG
jgi:hypothetical protein